MTTGAVEAATLLPPATDALAPAARRLRIALVGHACSSKNGSEPGFGWNWATHLARHHDVTMLTHPLFRADVDEEIAKNPREGLTFRWVEPPAALDPWRPDRGERGIRIHYAFWQRAVVRVLSRLHAERPFDLVHHVSWGSLNQPPLLWKTGIPFVWGPIGGGQSWPVAFLEKGNPARRAEAIRRMLVNLCRWNPAVIRAVRKAHLICATNRETADIVRELGARRVELFGDSGVPLEWLKTPESKPDTGNELVLFWAGRCEPRKGLPLALQAMADLPQGLPVRLIVAGDGPALPEWKELAGRLGLSARVTFLGRVPWVQMPQLFAGADAFVFTSLRDSAGSVVLEAMARGVPVVALDHQGVASLVPAEVGIKVPVTTPAETSSALARAFERLAREPQQRRQMAEAASAHAATQTWAQRAVQMSRWYEEILSAHRRL